MLNMHYFGARIVHTHWLNTYCGIMLKKHKQFFAHFIVCALSSVCVCVCCVCMRAAPLGTYETVPIISRRSEKKTGKRKNLHLMRVVYSIFERQYKPICSDVCERTSKRPNEQTDCVFICAVSFQFFPIHFFLFSLAFWFGERARPSYLVSCYRRAHS